MASDPIQEAITGLRAEEQATLERVRLIQTALAMLEQLIPSPAPWTPVPDDHVGVQPLSVKNHMLRLLVEADRDWSVNEILAEYAQRGVRFTVKDPGNALRAAVAEENKKGTIFRTSPGRYKASKWRPKPPKPWLGASPTEDSGDAAG